MKKYDLLRSGDNIIRVLEVQDDRVLVIDCIKRKMPVWGEMATLESYSECTIGELSEVTGVAMVSVDALDANQRKIMYERYTMIAPILSFLADDRMRPRLICSVAEEHGVSKQTVRSYLCLYLAYMDVAVLAPKRREDNQALTQDEKNIRWALNKFFYTTKKQSLMTAYTMMLKEKYCDALGVLAEEYPSYYQFRYFYRKTRNLQNFYISRDGLKDYQRNNRPLTGDGVQEFAPAVGVGISVRRLIVSQSPPVVAHTISANGSVTAPATRLILSLLISPVGSRMPLPNNVFFMVPPYDFWCPNGAQPYKITI